MENINMNMTTSMPDMSMSGSVWEGDSSSVLGNANVVRQGTVVAVAVACALQVLSLVCMMCVCVCVYCVYKCTLQLWQWPECCMYYLWYDMYVCVCVYVCIRVRQGTVTVHT